MSKKLTHENATGNGNPSMQQQSTQTDMGNSFFQQSFDNSRTDIRSTLRIIEAIGNEGRHIVNQLHETNKRKNRRANTMTLITSCQAKLRCFISDVDEDIIAFKKIPLRIDFSKLDTQFQKIKRITEEMKRPKISSKKGEITNKLLIRGSANSIEGRASKMSRCLKKILQSFDEQIGFSPESGDDDDEDDDDDDDDSDDSDDDDDVSGSDRSPANEDSNHPGNDHKKRPGKHNSGPFLKRKMDERSKERQMDTLEGSSGKLNENDSDETWKAKKLNTVGVNTEPIDFPEPRNDAFVEQFKMRLAMVTQPNQSQVKCQGMPVETERVIGESETDAIVPPTNQPTESETPGNGDVGKNAESGTSSEQQNMEIEDQELVQLQQEVQQDVSDTPSGSNQNEVIKEASRSSNPEKIALLLPEHLAALPNAKVSEEPSIPPSPFFTETSSTTLPIQKIQEVFPPNEYLVDDMQKPTSSDSPIVHSTQNFAQPPVSATSQPTITNPSHQDEPMEESSSSKAPVPSEVFVQPPQYVPFSPNAEGVYSLNDDEEADYFHSGTFFPLSPSSTRSGTSRDTRSLSSARANHSASGPSTSTASVHEDAYENEPLSPIVISVTPDELRARFAESDARFAVRSVISVCNLNPDQISSLYKTAKIEKEEKISALALIDPSSQYDGSNFRGLDRYFEETITPEFTPKGTVVDQEMLQVRLTGPIHIDPLAINSKDLENIMKEYTKDKVNPVYDSKTKVQLPTMGMEKCNEDQRWFKEKAGYEGEFEKHFSEGMLLATPCVDLNKVDDEDVENVFKKLPDLLAKFPISLVRGVQRASKIDYGLFELDRITEDMNIVSSRKTSGKRGRGRKIEKEEDVLKIEVLRQFAQPPNTNWTFLEEDSSWKTFGIQTEVDFEEFKDNYLNIQRICKEAGEKIKENLGKKELEEVVAKLIEDLRGEQVRCNAEEGSEEKQLCEQLCDKFKPILATFGTNFDLKDHVFPEQYTALKNFPVGFQPDGPGDLLSHSGLAFDGINRVQEYFKAPGSRTGAHIETAALYSVNINIGPGSCDWYGVAPEHAGHLEKLIERKFPMNVGEDGEGSIYGVKPWPSLKDLEAEKIPFYKFTQGPDEMVFVGPMTFHWVETTGFTRNISYNVALPTKTQLQSMIVMYDHCTSRGTSAIIPVPTILWKIAEEGLYMEDDEDLEFFKTVKFPLTKLHAHAEYENLVRGKGKNPIRRTDSKVDKFCAKCERNLVNFFGFLCRKSQYHYCLQCLEPMEGQKDYMSKRNMKTSKQRWEGYLHRIFRREGAPQQLE